MFPYFQWLQSFGFLTDLRESGLAYPIIMTGHLCGMALFGGLILMTDMRLLGLALTQYSISEVVDSLRPWKRLGGALTMFCGILLFSSEAEKYYPNPFFWWKMVFLAGVCIHAAIFRSRVYDRAKEFDQSPMVPTRVKAAAVASLVLWTGLVTFGRLIGYWEGPQQKQTQAQNR